MKKAKGILEFFGNTARRTMANLVDKGALSVDESQRIYVYRLQQHLPEG